MSVARLGALQSKAYTNAYQRIISTGRMGSQYSYYNDYKVYSRIQLTPSRTRDIVCGRFCFNGTTTNGDELEYFIRVYPFGNYSSLLSESEWVSANTWIQGFNVTSSAGASNPDETLELWVRRKDGGILTPSSLDYTLVSWDCTMMENVAETTAIPSNWLETTTQSIPTYTTQTTMVTTVDYESFLTTLTVPVDIRPAIAQFDQIINDLWSLHYIPFLVCFALIMGLAIWLLH